MGSTRRVRASSDRRRHRRCQSRGRRDAPQIVAQGPVARRPTASRRRERSRSWGEGGGGCHACVGHWHAAGYDRHHTVQEHYHYRALVDLLPPSYVVFNRALILPPLPPPLPLFLAPVRGRRRIQSSMIHGLQPRSVSYTSAIIKVSLYSMFRLKEAMHHGSSGSSADDKRARFTSVI